MSVSEALRAFSIETVVAYPTKDTTAAQVAKGLDAHTTMKRDSVIFKTPAHHFAQGLAKTAKKRGRKRLHHSDFESQPPGTGGHLHPDETRADEDQAPGVFEIPLQPPSIFQASQEMNPSQAVSKGKRAGRAPGRDQEPSILD